MPRCVKTSGLKGVLTGHWVHLLLKNNWWTDRICATLDRVPELRLWKG